MFSGALNLRQVCESQLRARYNVRKEAIYLHRKVESDQIRGRSVIHSSETFNDTSIFSSDFVERQIHMPIETIFRRDKMHGISTIA